MSGFEIIHHDPEALLSDLDKLEKEGYIFRGVEQQAYLAQPSAFRPEKIKENWNKYPISHSEFVSKWFHHPKVLKIIQASYPIPDFEIKRHPTIQRLFTLLSYLMVCNYLFSKYKEDNPKHAFISDHEQMKYRKSPFWTEQETFTQMVGYYFPKVLTLEALDKSWKKDSYIDEIFTGIDMSFPQHYGIPTAALDFTRKALISIYFAIESHLNIDLEHASGFYIAEKAVDYDSFLSIYAIKLTDDSNYCPIKVEEIELSIPNPRAKNQHGTLCYFSKPCSFHMEYGRFPTIEDYLINKQRNHFYFEKLSLKRSVSNLDFLVNILITESITKNHIYPD